MKPEKYPMLYGIVICCLLCSITLFVYSHRFVNVEVTPKWLGLMLAVGIAGVAGGLLYRKNLQLSKPVNILLTGSLLFIIIRTWAMSGVLWIYPLGLLLLFYLVQCLVTICPPPCLWGTVIFLALALSVQGLFQYAGLIPSSGNFIGTGSFDNPAGFAAALACTLPLCFHFIKHPLIYVRYTAIVAALLMIVAVILSGSRAGMLAIAAAMTIWFLSNPKFKTKSAKIFLAVAVVILVAGLYFFKKDSADGRLLIWRTSLDMVADRPVFGHGSGAFHAKYMLYQADYFNAHPDSQYAQLADNVLHPFNEYVLVLCEHGITGLVVVALLGFLLVRIYRRNRSNEQWLSLISLSSLAVFSFFSYPFKYSFTWVLLFLNIAVLCNPVREALAMAKKIIDKDVKIPSSTISAIKKEMRLLIEVSETTDEPASANYTLKPSGNEHTGQGETPQVQPNGAALPP